jgi:uncharacterized integral membrane protein
MTKNVLIALVLIVISTIILIFSRDSVTVSFVFTEIKAMASIVYLCFISLGVVIGVLLK